MDLTPPITTVKPETIDDVLKYYRNSFVPIFSLATAISGTLPEQILNELRNCLDHLSRSAEGHDIEGNIQKAKSHIDRSCLDCAKIAWVTLYREAETSFKQYTPHDYSLVDNGSFWLEVSEKYKLLREISISARQDEAENINNNLDKAISSYCEAIKIALDFEKLIVTKIPEIERQKELYRKTITGRELKIAIFGAIVGTILAFILGLCIQ